MSVAQYCLSWNSYKNNVCDGFAQLQQNGEFVDMTLAADGHLVNVHRNLIALASPYLKEILQSTPSHYPVIFLSSISHEILGYILEYIYTGEVSVGVDKVKLFMKAATELHLVGFANSNILKDITEKREINNIDVPKQSVAPVEVNSNLNVSGHIVSTEKLAFNDNSTVVSTQASNLGYNATNTESIAIHADNYDTTQSNVDKRNNKSYSAGSIQYRLDIQNTDTDTDTPSYTVSLIDQAINVPKKSKSIIENLDANIDFNLNDSSHILTKPIISTNDANELCKSVPPNMLVPNDLIPQYTMSSRGSLQLILNRYMYYCHHQSFGGRKRRWRCVDYRKTHCVAFIDTDLEVITTRKFIHSHPFHDDKIKKKINKNLIFTSLNRVLEQIKYLKPKSLPSNTDTKMNDGSDNITF